MKRLVVLPVAAPLLLGATWSLAQAGQPCRTIHGRANFYAGDGQLRIWHIGTHHEFQPDATSWQRVLHWIDEGLSPEERQQLPIAESSVTLFGNFVICPTEPFKQGAVQTARFVSVTHRRYVRAK